MTEFVITEKIQNRINYFRRFPTIFLSVTAGPPSSDIIVPESLVNPVMFTFRIHNEEAGKTADVQLILSEETYNEDMPDYAGADIDFLKQIVNYNAPHSDNGISTGCVLCPDVLSLWIDPATHKFVPIMGIHHEPTDQTTVDPMLQTLLGKIRQIPGIVDVVIYEFNDPNRLEKMQSEFAYKCYCYFGESTGYDGLNNVATALPTNVYMEERYHEPTIENIKMLLEKALLTQQA